MALAAPFGRQNQFWRNSSFVNNCETYKSLLRFPETFRNRLRSHIAAHMLAVK